MKKFSLLISYLWTDSTAFACVGTSQPFEGTSPILESFLNMLFSLVLSLILPLFFWSIILLISTRKEKKYFKIPRRILVIGLVLLLIMLLGYIFVNNTSCVGGVDTGIG